MAIDLGRRMVLPPAVIRLMIRPCLGVFTGSRGRTSNFPLVKGNWSISHRVNVG